ncbi:transcriptional regulator [Gordonia sp. zg691]|uniref:helix-turn-helix domain-containing protein n=1 Tax=Gordonia jinghuaiqii TaxID=2758710 RepID=UPI001662862A|nr:helix-turn-helix domain-containing protein [Gordonia jinghuaiqii]MBD0862188.1 transcriptional regulator [Gordonia jinghuaiqii]
MTVPIQSTTDLAVLDRDLRLNRDAIMSGAAPPPGFSGDVVESWGRVRAGEHRFTSDVHAPGQITRDELEARRAAHPLRDAVEPLKRLFAQSADDASMVLGIFDVDGVMLWRGGSSAILPEADRLDLVEGSRWDEDSTATTAVALAIRHQRPSRLFGAEHYCSSLHGVFCTAVPVHDHRTGEMVAVAGLAGPALQMQPAATAFTSALAALGEHEVTLAHQRELADLRFSGRSQLAGLQGPGLLIDDDGWVAEGRGCTPPVRVAAPTDDMRQFVPGLGICVVERLGKGWLVRPAGPTGPVLAELDLDGEPTITVTGDDEPWRTVLTRRHAQILLLLADAGEQGLTSQRLSQLLFGDDTHTVSVRAELSRLRRVVGALVSSRPYRLAPRVELRVTADQLDVYRAPTGRRRAARHRNPV